MASMLTLRPPRLDDEALAVALHRDEAVARYLWTYPRLNMLAAREWFITAAGAEQGTYFPAILEDGVTVGFGWFGNCDGVNAMLSIALVRHRGKGLGYEAARLLLAYAFDDLKLHRVSTTVVEANVPARKLAERFGTLEGRMREAWEADPGVGASRQPVYIDVLVYGVLEAEWRALEAAHG